MILPETPEALAAHVRDADAVPIPLFGGDGLSFAALSGEIQHDVADGVVSCLAGTTLAELNAVLGRDDRCVPYAKVWPAGIDRLADLILLGLPHAAEGRYGSWRDWILGATMVTAEGEIVKSGSRVVKSVAGYDAHKLLVGSRGTLVLPARVSLRTFHTSSGVFPQAVESIGENVRSILRVRLTDIRAALGTLDGDSLFVDESTGTLWTSRNVPDLPAFPDSWAMDPFRPSVDARLLPLHRRAKAVLDPGGKLASGAFHSV